MTKKEVFQLLKLIALYYEPYEISQEKVNEWFDVLKNESSKTLEQNLRCPASHSSYAPRISNLIRKPENGLRAIPNYEETLAFLYQPVKPASEEVIQCSLAAIREVLGIKRGEQDGEKSILLDFRGVTVRI